MSYSYIKSVFPNFESSQGGEKIFNSLNTLNTTPVSHNVTSPIQQKALSGHNEKSNVEFVIPHSKLETYAELDDHKKEPIDNQKYYKSPWIPRDLVSEFQNKAMGSQTRENVETFDNKITNLPVIEAKQMSMTSYGDCDDYLQHILNCTKCKESFSKQLGIETDKSQTEEMMELMSYIIFGVFILLLIDSLKRK
jgi:hypothetical protein